MAKEKVCILTKQPNGVVEIQYPDGWMRGLRDTANDLDEARDYVRDNQMFATQKANESWKVVVV